MACDLPFYTTNLCNEVFINKMWLSLTIFVLNPKKVICGVHSYGSVCGLRFANLVLPSDLCVRMLGQMRTKVGKASRDGSRSLGWLGAKIFRIPYFY